MLSGRQEVRVARRFAGCAGSAVARCRRVDGGSGLRLAEARLAQAAAVQKPPLATPVTAASAVSTIAV
jgi:hypothetical protein